MPRHLKHLYIATLKLTLYNTSHQPAEMSIYVHPDPRLDRLSPTQPILDKIGLRSKSLNLKNRVWGLQAGLVYTIV